ncbi:putative F-box/LRR-repeat protein At4g15060 [Gastrolobium bilobum]|uniref:putative F-box/LRR-repeat protein At4g15060 n=1 Tax=Gastrolobium bilobum TaxID=150636 RepID=UPI002AB1068F|nr:putative F-box/LRR-repeat protein At4g15060 [Gastrolobium bilobum]XP_061371125.1 putative F-box/LRR-repeat protein At4g15060 [Gastrolobium bilobum]XP_061371126.1 putative F-box/LRR-repeat protein At4g15060 [Gastrolobium bilobum]
METEGNSMKRQRASERDREEERDRLSDLPDCVLLHILNFINSKQAVQTCVLSKRWKHLWKRLTNLKIHSSDFRTLDIFRKFVSLVLSSRDGSISLHSLDFMRHGYSFPTILNKVITYAVLNNVQQLTLDVWDKVDVSDILVPIIVSCPSLTFLKIALRCDLYTHRLPNSLPFPSLKSLYLENVGFTASDNNCADPFSTCLMLNTLVIKDCTLHRDIKVFSISNSKLSSLTICNELSGPAHKLVLSVPNLSSLAILHAPIHQIFYACNLSLIKEINIDAVFPRKKDSVIISWLQVLANVKIMTLSSSILYIIQIVLSNPVSMRTQPPCFVRLESLKVKMYSSACLCYQQVSRAVTYLLQNSPLARVDIINC